MSANDPTTPRTPFWPAAFDDAGLDPYQVRVLLRVWRRAGDGGGEYRESNRRAADACRMSERQVRRALDSLEAGGWIETVEEKMGVVKKYRPRPMGAPAPQTAVSQAEVNTSAPQAEGVGPTDRTTSAYQADKGTPVKVLPEGTPPLRSAEASRPAPQLILKAPSNGAVMATIAEIIPPSKAGNPRRRPRLSKVVHNVDARPSWVAEAGDLWREATGGEPNYGRIGKALGALVNRESWEEAVRPAWVVFIHSTKRQYGVNYFAEHCGDFVPGAADRADAAELDDVFAGLR